jgi:hypothetical protein
MSMSDTNKRANESLEGPLLAGSRHKRSRLVKVRCSAQSSHTENIFLIVV